MAVVAEVIHDLAVKHRIALTRYSSGVVRKVIAFLNRIEVSVVERLVRTSNETVAGIRLEQLLAEIRSIQSQGWAIIDGRLTTDLADLAGTEIAFADKLVALIPPAEATVGAAFSGAPTLAQVMAAVNARPFQGRFLKDWLSNVGDSAAAKVRDAIRMGFVEGKTTDQIVRAIRGTAAANYRDGLMEGPRRDVEAAVRTAITHTASVAQDEVFKANADVIQALIWTSTLDSRTTPICQSRSEMVFPIGQGPRPPAHWNCRSVMRPQIAPIPGVVPFKAPTYQQWLKGQSAATQDDVLGATRGKLFRNGGLTVDRFVDRTGKTLTLDQLKARDAEAFAKAGLAV